jgi:hypothetical protein
MCIVCRPWADTGLEPKLNVRAVVPGMYNTLSAGVPLTSKSLASAVPETIGLLTLTMNVVGGVETTEPMAGTVEVTVKPVKYRS